MEKKSVNIFKFVEYRQFLTEAYALRAQTDPSFNKSWICRQMGLPNSRSFFSDILSGKKELSKSKTEMLIPIFQLEADEAQYFRLLVLYNQTQIKSEKEFYLDQLIALNRTPWVLVDRKAYEYYREWYTSAIRAFLDIRDLTDSSEDIQKIANAIYPAITVPQVKAAMDLLKRINFIEKTKQGYWKPSEKIIFTKSDLQDAFVKRYQTKCIELGMSAIYDSTLKPKKFVTRTLSVSSEVYAKIDKKLDQFLSEVRALVHKDENPADHLCQLNIQLYPQSRVKR